MKKILFFATVIALSSCITEENPSFQGQMLKNNESSSEIWICHNPESPIHQLVCSQDKESLCLEPGNSSKFCWKLHFQDCLRRDSEILRKVCKNFD
mgnify:CR=1 FL=1|tara:strand:- start:533 stop:820 length:288 start_codon:yes stop_codon:yes gene_type:complete